jgi:hypothetical protein
METCFENKRIYLNRLEWKSALRSTIIPETPSGDRSEFAVSLLMATATAPSILKTATDCIMSQQRQQKQDLINGLRYLKESLLTGQKQ